MVRRFQEAGVGCRPYFTPIHPQPFYRAEFGSKEGDFRVTEFAAKFAQFAEPAGRTSIAVPFHSRLTADEIDYVADVLERALGEVQ